MKKTSDSGDANSKCETCVFMATKCDNFITQIVQSNTKHNSSYLELGQHNYITHLVNIQFKVYSL